MFLKIGSNVPAQRATPMTSLTDRPAPATTQTPSWHLELLYDGECPLCLREVNFLRRKDGDRGLISFVDIADETYDPDLHAGIDFETAMGTIHAILPDGTVIKNLEVFRRVYSILGMGWVYAPTRWPVLGPLCDRLYRIWARWRLQLTGRPSLAAIVRDRQQQLECKQSDRCRLGETVE